MRQVPRNPRLGGIRIGIERAVQQTKASHTVHQRMVQFRVHREPSTFDPLDEVHLPQWPMPVEQSAVKPGHEGEQVRGPSRRGKRRVPDVVFEVDLLVDRPPQVAEAGHGMPGAFAERLVHHLGREELRVQVGHVVRARTLRRGEHFERSHVHRMLSRFCEQEDRIGHRHDPHGLCPLRQSLM